MVTVTRSTVNAIAAPTNHGRERRTVKPVSAAMSNAAAINSAIRANPCDVIITLTAERGWVWPVPVSTHC